MSDKSGSRKVPQRRKREFLTRPAFLPISLQPTHRAVLAAIRIMQGHGWFLPYQETVSTHDGFENSFTITWTEQSQGQVAIHAEKAVEFFAIDGSLAYHTKERFQADLVWDGGYIVRYSPSHAWCTDQPFSEENIARDVGCCEAAISACSYWFGCGYSGRSLRLSGGEHSEQTAYQGAYWVCRASPPGHIHGGNCVNVSGDYVVLVSEPDLKQMVAQPDGIVASVPERLTNPVAQAIVTILKSVDASQ